MSDPSYGEAVTESIRPELIEIRDSALSVAGPKSELRLEALEADHRTVLPFDRRNQPAACLLVARGQRNARSNKPTSNVGLWGWTHKPARTYHSPGVGHSASIEQVTGVNDCRFVLGVAIAVEFAERFPRLVNVCMPAESPEGIHLDWHVHALARQAAKGPQLLKSGQPFLCVVVG